MEEPDIPTFPFSAQSNLCFSLESVPASKTCTSGHSAGTGPVMRWQWKQCPYNRPAASLPSAWAVCQDPSLSQGCPPTPSALQPLCLSHRAALPGHGKTPRHIQAHSSSWPPRLRIVEISQATCLALRRATQPWPPSSAVRPGGADGFLYLVWSQPSADHCT